METSYLRLLHVEVDEKADTLNGSLNSIGLDEHPLYDALVYNDGGKSKKRVEWKLDNRKIDIDHDLESALRSLSLVGLFLDGATWLGYFTDRGTRMPVKTTRGETPIKLWYCVETPPYLYLS